MMEKTKRRKEEEEGDDIKQCGLACGEMEKLSRPMVVITCTTCYIPANKITPTTNTHTTQRQQLLPDTVYC
jgi:hypothetical protein